MIVLHLSFLLCKEPHILWWAPLPPFLSYISFYFLHSLVTMLFFDFFFTSFLPIFYVLILLFWSLFSLYCLGNDTFYFNFSSFHHWIFKVFFFFYLKDSYRDRKKVRKWGEKRERGERQRENSSSHWFTLQMATKLGQTKTRIRELLPGPLWGWKEPKGLGYSLPLFLWPRSELEQLRLKLVPICDIGIALPKFLQ